MYPRLGHRTADAREQSTGYGVAAVVYDGAHVHFEITVNREDVEPVEEVVHAHAPL